MIKHYIILSSSYTLGKRIALDFCDPEQLTKTYIMTQLEKIKDECGEDVSLATNMVHTDSRKWDSVVSSDAFFNNIKVFKSVDRFIDCIMLDRKLRKKDVINYITSSTKCTHSILQKLICICFNYYLCETGVKLFEDSQLDSNIVENDKTIATRPDLRMPYRSKILFTKKGNIKLNIIDRVLEELKE